MTVDELRLRHSVRNYTEAPLPQELIDSIRGVITDINSHEAGIRITLRTNDPEPFKGFRRSYGAFRNVRNYIAVIVDTAFPNVYQRAGYFSEQIVMHCVLKGLGTCFVGGTFDRDSVDVRIPIGEKLLYLIAVGYEDVQNKPTGVARVMRKLVHLKKMSPYDFLTGDSCKGEVRNIDKRLMDGLVAVSLAPSAVNRRPVRIQCDTEENISAVVKDSTPANLIDMGIAMYNFESVYPGVWEWGNPARFYPYQEGE